MKQPAWDTEKGTLPDDLPNVISNASGGRVRASFMEHATIQELETLLGAGSHTILSVNHEMLVRAYPDYNPNRDPRERKAPQTSGHNHLIELIGIYPDGQGRRFAHFNDSGIENGADLKVPVETAMSAWAQGNNSIVFTLTPDPNHKAPERAPQNAPAEKAPAEKAPAKKPADKKPADKKPADKKPPGKKAPAGKAPAKGDAPPTPGPHVKEYTPFPNDPLWQAGTSSPPPTKAKARARPIGYRVSCATSMSTGT